jgi:DNA invertase Pin-like site-specific DNA recombinase
MIAYSYIRFSTPEQLDGDSLRRQTEAARAWAGRNNVALDTKTTFRDLGRSGLGEHLKNPALGGLATFLALVEKKSIPEGSFLVVENADRLTRQGGWESIGLFQKIVMAGIRIVLLSPVERIIDRQTDTMEMIYLLLELSRGNAESMRKRELIGKNWQRWLATAGTSKEYRPGKRPFWLDRVGDGYALNEHAAAVRLIYKLAASGWGHIRIAKHLREKSIRPLTKSKASDGWLSPSSLANTLKNPAVYGRCEELDTDDFFPVVISKDEWFRVQGACAGRKKGGGGKSGWVHLLKGLVVNRDSGSVYYPYKASKSNTKVYLTSDYKKGGSTSLASFPVHAIERAICDCVQELDWKSLFPSQDGASEEILALSGEILELKGRIAEAQLALEGGKPLTSLLPVFKKWEDRIVSAQKEIDALKLKSTPKKELFTDLKGLLSQVLDDVELRLQVKSLISRIVSAIEVEFRGWGKWRGAYCTVRLHDSDQFRDVFVLYHKPHRTANGTCQEHLQWDCQRLDWDADFTKREDVFDYLKQQSKEIDSERDAEKRERKRLVSARWHKKRKKG